MSRKVWLTLTCGLAAIGCIGVLGGRASAAPADHVQGTGGSAQSAAPSRLQPGGQIPGGFPSLTALYAMQQKLDVAATKIAAADGAGRAGIEVSAARREVLVYWPGAVPTQVRALAGRLGVHVIFHQAAFSQRALVAEARQLAALPGVADAAPKADGSGLAVTVTSAPTAKATADVRAASRIPLTITIGQRPQTTAGRQNDNIPPFSGGSRYVNPSAGLACSNGFAISDNLGMLSAGHCGSIGQNVTIGYLPSWTGTIQNKNACRDIMEISYPQHTVGRVYNGAYNSSSTLGVFGVTPDFVGDLVETDGASSGEHSLITVSAVDVYTSFSGISCGKVGPLIKASYGDGVSCADAPGDSGGPVYTDFGSSNVLGRGTIVGGETSVSSCPGLSSSGNNTVYYAPLIRPPGDPDFGTLQAFGISLATG